jgi:hypothetical protein
VPAALVADREVDDRCSNEQRADATTAAQLLAEQADRAEQAEHGYEIEHDRRPAGVDAREHLVVDQETEGEPDRADRDGREPIPRGGVRPRMMAGRDPPQDCHREGDDGGRRELPSGQGKRVGAIVEAFRGDAVEACAQDSRGDAEVTDRGAATAFAGDDNQAAEGEHDGDECGPGDCLAEQDGGEADDEAGLEAGDDRTVDRSGVREPDGVAEVGESGLEQPEERRHAPGCRRSVSAEQQNRP